MGLMAWEGLYVLFTVDDVTPAERKVLTDPSTDMALAVGPVFVTQSNPSMTNIPLRTITNVISQNTLLFNL